MVQKTRVALTPSNMSIDEHLSILWNSSAKPYKHESNVFKKYKKNLRSH